MPPAPAPQAAPRTTVAPFQAVPTPDPVDEPAPARPAETPRRRAADRVRPWADHAAPPAASPTGSSGEPSWSSSPPPAVAPAAGAAAGYRDWTSPSRTRDERPAPPPATEAIPDRTPAGSSRAAAPATEAIPDRTPAWDDESDDRYEDDRYEDDRYDEDRYDDRGHDGRHDDGRHDDGRYDDEDRSAGGDRSDGDRDRRGPDTGSSTGVVGGRAAFRAERQAAEAERLRAVRTARQEEARSSGVRRVAVGLLAVAVVALVVLGVYSFTSSEAQEASRSTSPELTATTPAPAVPSSALPPLDVQPLPPVDAALAEPVRVPVTVLNATGVSGLAGDITAELTAGGWASAGVGEYQGADVATTTVYFTEGDQAQYDAAVQLMQQFPQISGPAVRFFEVPDVADPGLVVVTTGEWRP
ncbi:LytR C-terminal domain-containing protein [Geodermatophilus poikilotrophus]|uniref:LytR C-terminal domain-containing protein n=1 Tax=Geodermatophilus poikilotrophus TaxID=1333667 RepID=UPI00111377DE|nr:LytR C-terminal domain-containing protein [Geodermatophilus poikilotrophus]